MCYGDLKKEDRKRMSGDLLNTHQDDNNKKDR